MSTAATVECVTHGADPVYLSQRMNVRACRATRLTLTARIAQANALHTTSMTNARLGPAIPILDVRHIEEAISFYTDRLGFDVDFRYENDPENYAGVRRDDVRLHMQRQDDEHLSNGTAGRLKFRVPVSDPDALFAEFKVMGVLDDDIEVQDTDWGTREFGFRDPDGNGLVFFKIL